MKLFNRLFLVFFGLCLALNTVGCGGGGGGGSASPTGPVITDDDTNIAADLTTKASAATINQFIVGSWRREGSFTLSDGSLSIDVTKQVQAYSADGTYTTEIIGNASKDGKTLNMKITYSGKYTVNEGTILYSQSTYDSINLDTNSYVSQDVAAAPTPDIVNNISATEAKITFEEESKYYGAKFYKQ